MCFSENGNYFLMYCGMGGFAKCLFWTLKSTADSHILHQEIWDVFFWKMEIIAWCTYQRWGDNFELFQDNFYRFFALFFRCVCIRQNQLRSTIHYLEELDFEGFLGNSSELEHLLALLPLLDKKERVERVLMEEILEITIPRNFKKIGGSSIRFGPVRGVVTCEKKTGCDRSFCALWAQIVQPRCAGDPLKKPLDSQANNTFFS